MVRATFARQVRPRARLWLALAATLAVAIILPGAARADGTHMHCDSPGWCYWGYNIVGNATNPYVHGPYNYWADQYFDKMYGDWVRHGFGPAANCFKYEFGAATWYGYPSQLGCGGYIYPYTRWDSGNASYLKFNDAT